MRIPNSEKQFHDEKTILQSHCTDLSAQY